jgi:hypothetical protein
LIYNRMKKKQSPIRVFLPQPHKQRPLALVFVILIIATFFSPWYSDVMSLTATGSVHLVSEKHSGFDFTVSIFHLLTEKEIPIADSPIRYWAIAVFYLSFIACPITVILLAVQIILAPESLSRKRTAILSTVGLIPALIFLGRHLGQCLLHPNQVGIVSPWMVRIGHQIEPFSWSVLLSSYGGILLSYVAKWQSRWVLLFSFLLFVAFFCGLSYVPVVYSNGI